MQSVTARSRLSSRVRLSVLGELTIVAVSVALVLLSAGMTHAEQAKPRSTYKPLELRDFAIQDMKGALAWRDLKVGRKLLRTLLTHAPRLSRLSDAARKLEQLSWEGLAPWRGESKGIDPRRGVILFWDSAGRYRLLISSRPERSKSAVLEARAFAERALGLEWQLSCQLRGTWSVCDAVGVRDGQAPYWLTPSLDRGALWCFVQTPEALPKPFVLPWESVELHADLNEEALSLSVSLGAGFNPLLEVLRPQSDLSAVNVWVHERSPLAFKLSLNPEVLNHAGLLASESAWIRYARRLLKAGWSGEVLLTFDGGLDHPIIALSLAPHPWSADQLSATLCELIGARVATPEERRRYEQMRRRDRGLAWWLIHSDASDEYRADPPPDPSASQDNRAQPWRIPVLKTPDTLLIALFPADLRRRTSDEFPTYHAPISVELDQRGVSGGFLDPAIFELNSLNGGRLPLSTLYAALTQLWREGGSGLIDVPAPLAGESHSLAGALTRLARFESEHLVALFSPLTQDSEIFMALSDLTSLALQLTEALEWTIYTYTQTETGGVGLGFDLRWVIL